MAVSVPVISTLKPILYLSSPLITLSDSSSSNDYFVQLLTLIVQKIKEVLKLDTVIKLAESNESLDQVSLLKESLIKSTNGEYRYSAIIISPVNENHIWHVLKDNFSSIEDYKKIPIITIDKKINNSVNGLQIPLISSDWYNGGRCAAESIKKKIDEFDDKSSFNILIIPGLEGSKERIDGFKSLFEENEIYNRKIFFIETPKANFTREGAKRVFIEFNAANQISIDFIFACNDEMALGIKEIISQDQDNSYKNTLIVGFDGTKEFKAATATDANLLATVDVNLEEQVKILVEKIQILISDLQSYDDLSRFTQLISYKPYINSNERE